MFTRLAQFALIVLAVVISDRTNAAPLIYGTYYDDTKSNSCDSTAASCRANFSQLPSDKLVLIRKINCTVISQQQVVQAALQVSATLNGSALGSRYLPIAVPPSHVSSANYYTSWETNTGYLLGNGRFPFLVISQPALGSMFFACTIIGDLVTSIQ